MVSRSPNNNILTGTVHGKTVELDHKTNLPDGERVNVVLNPMPVEQRAGVEGLLEAFGGWSDDPEGVDEFIEEMRRQRNLPTPHREIDS